MKTHLHFFGVLATLLLLNVYAYAGFTYDDDPNPESSSVKPATNTSLYGSALKNFTLVDADTNEDLFVLTEGMEINIAEIQHRTLNIRANPSDDVNPLESDVDFMLSGPIRTSRTEGFPPFAVFGDLSGDYIGVSLPIGAYTIKASLFLDGILLDEFSISFSIVEHVVTEIIGIYEQMRQIYL